MAVDKDARQAPAAGYLLQGVVGRLRSGLRRWLLGVALLGTLGLGSGLVMRAANETAIVFGSDAGLVLTFVRPDKTEEFEGILIQFRQVLRASEDPIRQQQSENWRVFRSPEPGPNGSALYVGFMEPVLKGANYSISDIVGEELPSDEATTLLGRLATCLSQPQQTLSLDTVVDMTTAIEPPTGPGSP